MGTWNYRVLAHKHKGEIFFQIHSVYYNKKGTPDGYGSEGAIVLGENLKEIKKELSRFKRSLRMPILWAGKKFPAKYKKD